MSPISWAEIDTNFNSKGYLDTVEVINAKKKGVTNVFVGMIQEDYEGGIDIEKVIKKYNQGAKGRMPVNMSSEQKTHVQKLYRELIVLQMKRQNLQNEYDKKYGLWDDVKNMFSKIGIAKQDKEYKFYNDKLYDYDIKIKLKEQELTKVLDTYMYRPYRIDQSGQLVICCARPASTFDY